MGSKPLSPSTVEDMSVAEARVDLKTTRVRNTELSEVAQDLMSRRCDARGWSWENCEQIRCNGGGSGCVAVVCCDDVGLCVKEE